MSEPRIPGIDPSGSSSNRNAQIQRLRQVDQSRIEAQQIEAEKSMEEYTDEPQFNAPYMMRKAEDLERRIRRQEIKSNETTQEGDAEVVDIEAVQKTAEEYEQRNPEMQKRSLIGLKHSISMSDSPEQILAKVLKSYPDHFLADEALDFLCASSDKDSKIGINLRRAKELLNERFGREVRAGRNINMEAREFSRQGLGSAGSLRDLYRDVTGNPRNPVDLFEELHGAFTFDKLKTVLKFLLHSIGSDLKSKGPSISRPELQGLFTETRTMQAILGVFRFFFQRMRLLSGLFKKEELELPKKITFELLAKIFVKMIQERYPSPDKILRLAASLGISEELLAQVLIFTQYRDAMRGVSPRLFKSERHRQDLLMALIETISELDDLIDEEDDDDEDEDEDLPKAKGYSPKDTID